MMNYYEILGVSADATDQQIKEAYRREAMRWHPDRHEGAAAKAHADKKFKELALAYRTLRDPAAREAYDREVEQKLREEYNARQRQQGEQQKEWAQQAQNRHDFADTEPPSQEEAMSSDYANQIFFEQMLDLAFELSGRGFPEFNIVKALVALGCPESLAKTVASVAIQRGGDSGAAKTTGPRTVAAISNVDDAEWGALEPYFTAIIIGNAPQSPLSEERYNAVLATIAGRTRLWLKIGIALLVVAFAVTRVTTHDLGISFAWTFLLGLLLLILGILGRSSFLGPDKRMFFSEKTKRFYLNSFKILHAKDRGIILAPAKSFRLASGNYIPEAFLFTVGWLGYRRIYTPAFLIALALAGFYTALTVYGVPDKTQNIFALPLCVLIANFANRMYFNNAKAKIRTAIIDAEPEQALAKLRIKGGTNVFGWIFPFAVFIICLAPAILIEEDRNVDKQRVEQEAKAVQTANEQAAVAAARQQSEQQAQARVQMEYNRAIRSIEARFPQLNPDAPQYNPAAVNWVIERKKMYDQVGGRTTTAALQQAVDDFAAELQRQAPAQPYMNATGTPQ